MIKVAWMKPLLVSLLYRTHPSWAMGEDKAPPRWDEVRGRRRRGDRAPGYQPPSADRSEGGTCASDLGLTAGHRNHRRRCSGSGGRPAVLGLTWPPTLLLQLLHASLPPGPRSALNHSAIAFLPLPQIPHFYNGAKSSTSFIKLLRSLV